MKAVVLIDQLVLLAAAGSLLAAAIRIASLWASRGAERVVAAIVIAAAAAVGEMMLLGLLDLDGSRPALTVAAVATWLAARALTPAPGVGVWAELTQAWSGCSRPNQILLGAAVGLLVANAISLLVHPTLGIDGLSYHAPEALALIQQNHQGPLGNVAEVLPVLPATAYYPLTNEVLLAWGLAVSGTLVPIALMAPGQLAVLAFVGWVGLRRLAVPKPLALVGVAAFCAMPELSIAQSNGPTTDLPTLMWLAAAGVLGLAAFRSPGLLAPALLAIALALGTKTTAAVTALALLVAGAVVFRDQIRAQARPVLAATLLGLLVGGYWYLRNLAVHGSPAWPFITVPWGSSPPAGVVLRSFLNDPGTILRQHGHDYLREFGSGLLLMASGMVAAVVSRRRAPLIVAAVCVLGGLSWLTAPATGGVTVAGLSLPGIAVSTLRYLLPAAAAGLVALVMAPRSVGGRAVAGVVLAFALGLGLYRDQQLGLNFGWIALLIGIGAGPAIALVLARTPAHGLRLAAASAAVGVAIGVAVAASGFVTRHVAAGQFDAPLVQFVHGQPGFLRARQVAISGGVDAVLSGDYLENRLVPIFRRDSCALIHRYAGSGWVVSRSIFVLKLPNVARCLRGVARTRAGEFTLYRETTAGS